MDHQNPTDKNNCLRHNWSTKEIIDLISLPINDLIYLAQTLHRKFFNQNQVQLSTLMNIKTGGCPENCAYCPQSAHYKTGVKSEKLISKEAVKSAAVTAKRQGAGRFCMGAAWRSPSDTDLEKVAELVEIVKKEGLETCVTLGMLNSTQAIRLKQAGLDYYNHNLDTSEAYYKKIITTRTYQDRLDTLAAIRDADIKVCCGGIVGMGESRQDRAEMLKVLACMPVHPESVPINMLVRVKGTPLQDCEPIASFELVRTIAAARILMPASYVRLSAGRSELSDEYQALCFLAGANSIFYGEKLLTTENPQHRQDQKLFSELGIEPLQ